jgi:hypothetical protein
MTQKDQVFVVDLVVSDPTREMMVLNVINRLIGTTMEFSAIVKICKYIRLHEGHHFILMAMEVHGTPKRDTNCFIRECAYLFYDRRSRGHF